MRPLLHGDLVAAARALRAAGAEPRAALMCAILAGARLADAHRSRTGRPHPRFGTGSLMAAAAAWPQAPEPVPFDADYLDCLAQVIAALQAQTRFNRSGSAPRG